MTGIDMNKFIVSLALMYCFSFNTYAISPEEKARKIIAEEKAYVIKEKAKANAIARRMNREREEVKIWGNAKEIEKHLRATYDFQDFLRYEAQRHFEGAGILTDRYDMAKAAEADFLPVVNRSKTQLSIYSGYSISKHTMGQQTIYAKAYWDWCEKTIDVTLTAKDKVWAREQWMTSLYYYSSALKMYNRSKEDVLWAMHNYYHMEALEHKYDEGTIRRKLKRRYIELDEDYRMSVLRALEDQVKEEKAIEDENIVNMSYAMLHLSAKDKAVRLMLDLVDKEVIAELTSLIK